jgi:hypothetical protein
MKLTELQQLEEEESLQIKKKKKVRGRRIN